jgi:hypothetical protein
MISDEYIELCELQMLIESEQNRIESENNLIYMRDGK